MLEIKDPVICKGEKKVVLPGVVIYTNFVFFEPMFIPTKKEMAANSVKDEKKIKNLDEDCIRLSILGKETICQALDKLNAIGYYTSMPNVKEVLKRGAFAAAVGVAGYAAYEVYSNASIAHADSPSSTGPARKASPELKPSLEIIQLPTIYKGPGEQTHPLIGGQNGIFAVAQNWELRDPSLKQIYGKRLDTGEIFPINLIGINVPSQIEGRLLAYLHNGNEIRVFDLEGRGDHTVPGEKGEKSKPDISEDNIVWVNKVDGGWTVDGFKISALANLKISSDSDLAYEKADAQVSKDIVVWRQKNDKGRWGAVAKKLSGEEIGRVFRDDADITEILLSEERLAFTESKDPKNPKVKVKLSVIDISGREQEIEPNRNSIKTNIKLAGEFLVWSDKVIGESESSILLKHLKTGQLVELTRGQGEYNAGKGVWEFVPAIFTYGDHRARVVWSNAISTNKSLRCIPNTDVYAADAFVINNQQTGNEKVVALIPAPSKSYTTNSLDTCGN